MTSNGNIPILLGYLRLESKEVRKWSTLGELKVDIFFDRQIIKTYDVPRTHLFNIYRLI